VERPVAAADLRRNLKVFGQTEEESKDLAAKETIVLSLGNVSPLERQARDEVAKIMAELENTKVEIKDPNLSKFVRERAEPQQFETKDSSALASGPKYVRQRIRVSNITSDITERELYRIFGPENGLGEIQRIFWAYERDPKTREINREKRKQFCYIAYHTEEDGILAQKKMAKTKFKHTILSVDFATETMPRGGA
jgi:hypothetical protein